MSYIDFLNAFERFCETHTLLPSSILLYYKLLCVANRCGWPDWFGIDNDRLMFALQTRDNKKLMRARKQLLDCKIIAYQRGRKGVPGRYHLCDDFYSAPVYAPTKTPDILRQRQKQRPECAPPSLEQVMDFCAQFAKDVDANRFFHYYAARGWRVAGAPMQDWQAAVKSWSSGGQASTAMMRSAPKFSAQK